jgi:hypothetical protein
LKIDDDESKIKELWFMTQIKGLLWFSGGGAAVDDNWRGR